VLPSRGCETFDANWNFLAFTLAITLEQSLKVFQQETTDIYFVLFELL
jgi:hypothetical protein